MSGLCLSVKTQLRNGICKLAVLELELVLEMVDPHTATAKQQTEYSQTKITNEFLARKTHCSAL